MIRALAVLLGMTSAALPALSHEWTLLAALEDQAAQEPPFAPEPGARLIPLRISLRDAGSGAEVPGNVRVIDERGRPLALDLRSTRPRGWYSIAGPVEVRVPAARLRVEAFRGLETGIATRELDLTGQSGAQLELALARFYSAAEHGLASGNTHLHLMAWDRARVEEYLRVAAAADQLDFAWVSYLFRQGADTPYTSNDLTRADLDALSTETTRFGWGEELRHNFGAYAIGYGHALLLDLRELVEPVSIGPILAGSDADAPGLAGLLDQARARAATVIWAHGESGYEDLPSWLLGRVDAQNLFDGGDRVPKPGHAAYGDTFYRLLDVGLRVPFSTGTDWFLGDLSRVYVPLRGEPTTAAWLAALREGRTFITNGPFLELEAGGEGPGGIVKRDGPAAIAVRARAIGRADFGALEIVSSQGVAARALSHPVGDHFEATLDTEIAFDAPGWLAARVAAEGRESELGGALFAHSSAITVELAGERPFRSRVARDLVLEMDWNARTIRSKGRFADAAQRDAVTAPYREAIRALSPQLAWRDRLHAWAVRALRTLRDWLGAS